MIANVDVVIDFTVPAATAEHARLAAQAEAALIAGTTGLNAEQEDVGDPCGRAMCRSCARRTSASASPCCSP